MNCGTANQCSQIVLQLLVIGLSNGAVIALNAIGVTLVYGAVRMINFAHGDVFALTTVVATFLVEQLGLQQGFQAAGLIGGLLLSLVAAMVFGAALNMGVERAAFRPFQGGSRLGPLIASVGLSFILYQAALLWRKTQRDFHAGEHRSVPGIPEVPLMRIPELLGSRNLLAGSGLNIIITAKDFLVVVLAILVAVAVDRFLRRTRTGRALRAVAQDPELALLCGVDRTTVIRLAFAIGGAVAGAAGWVFAIYYDRPFAQHGLQSGLVALTAAVLGGIGRPRGAFVSGLLLGVFTAFSDYFLRAQWTPVLVFLILIVLLALRPTGLAAEARDTEVSTAPPADSLLGSRGGGGRPYMAILLLAMALLFPILDQAVGLHLTIIAVSMLIFALLALGLQLLLGSAGLLNLGYAGCYAVGAYTAAFATSSGRLFGTVLPNDIILVLLLSALAAAGFGALLAVSSLRLRGDYLAIATLAGGLIVPRVVLIFNHITGGDGGLSALPPPRLFGRPLTTPLAWYGLALAVLVLSAGALYRIQTSRLGRAWSAMSADEVAAASSGINTRQAKTSAYLIGGAIAGIAGGLYATIFSYAHPSMAELVVTTMLLAMVVIGGARSLTSTIIGALVVASYDLFMIRWLGLGLDRIGQITGLRWLQALDLRSLSYGSFGLALYLTILLRNRQGRRPAAAATTRPPAGATSVRPRGA